MTSRKETLQLIAEILKRFEAGEIKNDEVLGRIKETIATLKNEGGLE